MQTVGHEVANQAGAVLPVLAPSEESVRIPGGWLGTLAERIPIDIVVAMAIGAGFAMIRLSLGRRLEWIVPVAIPLADLVVAAVIAVLPHDDLAELAGLDDIGDLVVHG